MNARSLLVGSAGVFVLAFVATPVNITAQQSTPPATHFTYAKDVAPIMQRSCQTCHRPGTNAPMSLLTYEDVRPWARAIKNKVTQRLMPPWHIERNVGIQQFKDDPSLSDAEIATIANWVDGGAPRGNTADMPAAPTFPDDEAWHIGTPDLIVEIPKPHTVPAAGGDLWIDYIADSGLTEDRYLMAVEAKPGPGARAVVHHLLTYLIQDIDENEVLAGRLDDRPTNNESFLNEFAVGKNGDILPEGTAKLVKAGGNVLLEDIPHFNGRLFDDDTVLELDSDGLDILARVSALDWSSIEPAILGTLFERSLAPEKRTLTNLYNQRPTWLDLAHQRLLALNLERAAGPEPALSH